MTIADVDRQRLRAIFEGMQDEDFGQLVEWAYEREQAVGGVPNWCILNLNAALHATASQPSLGYTQTDLTIASQSGDDFSIGPDAAHLLLSAGGGAFQLSVYFGSCTVDLDGSSDHLRWLEIAAQLGPNDGGDPNNPVTSLGLDQFIPVLPMDLANRGNLVSTTPSAIGYTQPGGVAIAALGISLIGGIGTDDVTLDNVGPCLLWQVG